MLDTIFIEDLHVDAVIGIHDWEKERMQPLYLDITLAWPTQSAVKTDSYDKTLCYDKVAQAVTTLLQQEPINLIETAAERVAALILEVFGASGVEVTLRKPTALKHARAAGVRIKRGTW